MQQLCFSIQIVAKSGRRCKFLKHERGVAPSSTKPLLINNSERENGSTRRETGLTFALYPASARFSPSVQSTRDCRGLGRREVELVIRPTNILNLQRNVIRNSGDWDYEGVLCYRAYPDYVLLTKICFLKHMIKSPLPTSEKLLQSILSINLFITLCTFFLFLQLDSYKEQLCLTNKLVNLKT